MEVCQNVNRFSWTVVITNILNKTSMKKKQYERPTMQVVQLKQKPTLLQASVNSGDVNATMNGTFYEEDI